MDKKFIVRIEKSYSTLCKENPMRRVVSLEDLSDFLDSNVDFGDDVEMELIIVHGES